jgi:hypothetical protein
MIMMVFLFILSPILLIVMFPMTFASFLFLLAIALHWARAGGSRAALVARLGILFGVIGILLSATPGLRAN